MYASLARIEISSSETENHDFLPSEMAICVYDWAVLGHLNPQKKVLNLF